MDAYGQKDPDGVVISSEPLELGDGADLSDFNGEGVSTPASTSPLAAATAKRVKKPVRSKVAEAAALGYDPGSFEMILKSGNPDSPIYKTIQAAHEELGLSLIKGATPQGVAAITNPPVDQSQPGFKYLENKLLQAALKAPVSAGMTAPKKGAIANAARKFGVHPDNYAQILDAGDPNSEIYKAVYAASQEAERLKPGTMQKQYSDRYGVLPQPQSIGAPGTPEYNNQINAIGRYMTPAPEEQPTPDGMKILKAVQDYEKANPRLERSPQDIVDDAGMAERAGAFLSNAAEGLPIVGGWIENALGGRTPLQNAISAGGAGKVAKMAYDVGGMVPAVAAYLAAPETINPFLLGGISSASNTGARLARGEKVGAAEALTNIATEGALFAVLPKLGGIKVFQNPALMKSFINFTAQSGAMTVASSAAQFADELTARIEQGEDPRLALKNAWKNVSDPEKLLERMISFAAIHGLSTQFKGLREGAERSRQGLSEALKTDFAMTDFMDAATRNKFEKLNESFKKSGKTPEEFLNSLEGGERAFWEKNWAEHSDDAAALNNTESGRPRKQTLLDQKGSQNEQKSTNRGADFSEPQPTTNPKPTGRGGGENPIATEPGRGTDGDSGAPGEQLRKAAGAPREAIPAQENNGGTEKAGAATTPAAVPGKIKDLPPEERAAAKRRAYEKSDEVYKVSEMDADTEPHDVSRSVPEALTLISHPALSLKNDDEIVNYVRDAYSANAAKYGHLDFEKVTRYTSHAIRLLSKFKNGIKNHFGDTISFNSPLKSDIADQGEQMLHFITHGSQPDKPRGLSLDKINNLEAFSQALERPDAKLIQHRHDEYGNPEQPSYIFVVKNPEPKLKRKADYYWYAVAKKVRGDNGEELYIPITAGGYNDTDINKMVESGQAKVLKVSSGADENLKGLQKTLKARYPSAPRSDASSRSGQNVSKTTFKDTANKIKSQEKNDTNVTFFGKPENTPENAVLREQIRDLAVKVSKSTDPAEKTALGKEIAALRNKITGRKYNLSQPKPKDRGLKPNPLIKKITDKNGDVTIWHQLPAENGAHPVERVIDPNRFRTGFTTARDKAIPTKRWYGYVTPEEFEDNVSANRRLYETKVKRSEIYDYNHDPENFQAKSRNDEALMYKLIKKAGYKGIFRMKDDGSTHLEHFYPTKATLVPRVQTHITAATETHPQSARYRKALKSAAGARLKAKENRPLWSAEAKYGTAVEKVLARNQSAVIKELGSRLVKGVRLSFDPEPVHGTWLGGSEQSLLIHATPPVGLSGDFVKAVHKSIRAMDQFEADIIRPIPESAKELKYDKSFKDVHGNIWTITPRVTVRLDRPFGVTELAAVQNLMNKAGIGGLSIINSDRDPRVVLFNIKDGFDGKPHPTSVFLEKVNKFVELFKEQNNEDMDRGLDASGVRHQAQSPILRSVEQEDVAIARVKNKTGARRLGTRADDRALPAKQFNITSKSKEYKAGSAELRAVVDAAEHLTKIGYPTRVEDLPDQIFTANELKELGYDPKSFRPQERGEYGYNPAEQTFLVTVGGHYTPSDPNVPDARGETVLNSRTASRDAAAEEAAHAFLDDLYKRDWGNHAAIMADIEALRQDVLKNVPGANIHDLDEFAAKAIAFVTSDHVASYPDLKHIDLPEYISEWFTNKFEGGVEKVRGKSPMSSVRKEGDYVATIKGRAPPRVARSKALVRSVQPEVKLAEKFVGLTPPPERFKYMIPVLDNPSMTGTKPIEFIRQALKGSSVKQAEREIVEHVINTFYPGEKGRINMAEFKARVADAIMPVTRIRSYQYATYGLNRVMLQTGVQASTVIYNAPITHGFTGHFGGEYNGRPGDPDFNYIVQEKHHEGNTYYIVIRENTPVTTEQEAHNAAYTVTHNRAEAERLAEKLNKGELQRPQANVGLFAHVREAVAPDRVKYITEMQSDVFQKETKADIENKVLSKTVHPAHYRGVTEQVEDYGHFLDSVAGLVNGSYSRGGVWSFNSRVENSTPAGLPIRKFIAAWAYYNSDVYANTDLSGGGSLPTSVRKFYSSLRGDFLLHAGLTDADLNKTVSYLDDIDYKEGSIKEEFEDIKAEALDYMRVMRGNIDRYSRFRDYHHYVNVLRSTLAESAYINDDTAKEIEKALDVARSAPWAPLIQDTIGQIEQLIPKKLEDLKRIDEMYPTVKQFSSYTEDWYKRVLREEIRNSAIDGHETLRFPTPRAIALIEGYRNENGRDITISIFSGAKGGETINGETPEVGRSFEHDGIDYIVIELTGTHAVMIYGGEMRRMDLDMFQRDQYDRYYEDGTEDIRDWVGLGWRDYAISLDDLGDAYVSNPSNVFSEAAERARDILEEAYDAISAEFEKKQDDYLAKLKELDKEFEASQSGLAPMSKDEHDEARAEIENEWSDTMDEYGVSESDMATFNRWLSAGGYKYDPDGVTDNIELDDFDHAIGNYASEQCDNIGTTEMIEEIENWGADYYNITRIPNSDDIYYTSDDLSDLYDQGKAIEVEYDEKLDDQGVDVKAETIKRYTEFSKEDVGDEDQANVIKQYAEKYIPYLKKLRPDLKPVMDEHGVVWYETKLKPEDGYSPVKVYNLQQGQGSIELPDETALQLVQRKLWDKYNRGGQLVDQGEKISPVPADARFRLEEELYIGRATDKIEHLHNLLLGRQNGLFKRLTKDGFTVDDLANYLYAKHAPERNREMQKENPNLTTGSGMEDADAQAILNNPKNAPLDNYAEEFYNIVTRDTLKRLEDSGIISSDYAQQLRDQYDYYVPLKGRPEDRKLPDWLKDVFRPRGKGMSVNTAGIIKAHGRESRARDVIVQAIMDAEDSIIRAEKNKVGQSFLNFVKQYPNDEIYQIEAIPGVTQQILKNGATMREALRKASRIRLEDNELGVYVDGDRKVIIIKDEALAKGLKNLGVEASIPILTHINNFLRNMITTYNPEFIISNFEKDLQDAMANSIEINAPMLRAKILKDVPSAIRGIYRERRDKNTAANVHQFSLWYNRFKANGGQTGWMTNQNFDEMAEKLTKQVRQFGHEPIFNKFIRESGELIEDVNSAVEYGVRVSTFKNLVEIGWSPKKAASFAKNLTVNFNKKGEWGSALNSMYMFSNAGIQGAARMMKSLKNKKTWMTAVPAMVSISLLLNWLNDKTNPEEWEKVPDYVKDSNYILMLPGSDKGLRIRTPYGYNIFNALANTAYDYSKKAIRGLPAVTRIFGAFADAFNPLGSTGSVSQMLSPTALDPFVQLGENKTFSGAPIRPDQPAYSPAVPQSQLYFNSVKPHSLWITDKLNKLTGGDEEKSGAIDISPEDLDFIQDYIFGGVGKFIGNAIGTGESLVKDRKPPSLNKVPVVRQFVTQTGDKYNEQTVYGMAKEEGRTKFNDHEVGKFEKAVDRLLEDEKIDKKRHDRLLRTFYENQGLDVPFYLQTKKKKSTTIDEGDDEE